MEQRIENLLRNVGKRMQENLARNNFQAATALAPLLTRLQTLQQKATEMSREISEIEAGLDRPESQTATAQAADVLTRFPSGADEDDEGGRARPRTLRVSINWQANHRDHAPEEICEHTAAATMAAFVTRVVQELGSDALKKLERIRIARGPLISKDPSQDFLNQAQGRPYGHKRLRGTDYYVLTHSPTAQKVEDINRICKVLGLVPGSVQIEQADRNQLYV